MNLANQSFTSISQLNNETLFKLFQTAKKITPIAKGQAKTDILKGAILANVFFEPSTRTRMSFDSAFARLGGHVNSFSSEASSTTKGESLEDTGRMISAYADIAVIRHPQVGSAQTFSDAASIPVINAGDGSGEHPTQALLDCYTIHQYYPKIDGLSIAFTGDLKYGRAVHSLFRLLCDFKNISFNLVSPAELAMPSELILLAKQNGHSVTEFSHPQEGGLVNADFIYGTRIQQERFDSKYYESIKSSLFSIDYKTIQNYANESVKILHPLPRDARKNAYDLSADLDNDPRLICFKQAENGLPVRMALFLEILNTTITENDIR